jgi:hypothetical protein
VSVSDVPRAWTDPEALTEYTQAEYDAFTELLNSPDTPAAAVRYAATSMAVALSVTAENGTPTGVSRRNACRTLRRTRRSLESFTTQEDPV